MSYPYPYHLLPFEIYVSRMVWCQLEEPYPLHPRAPKQMCLHGVILCHLLPTVQQHVGLPIQGLHPTSQQHLTRTLRYKVGFTLWWGTVDPSLPPVITTWPNKMCLSKLSSLLPILTYLLIPLPSILFLSIKFLPFLIFSLLMRRPPTTSWLLTK